MGNQKEGKPQTSPIHQLEAEKREHKNKMKRMEAEMEQVFELKVKEKINRLNDSELGYSLLLKFSIKMYRRQVMDVGDRFGHQYPEVSQI